MLAFALASLALMAIPGPPIMDTETAAQVRDLMGKGFAGALFLTTDDCQAAYEDQIAEQERRAAAEAKRANLARDLPDSLAQTVAGIGFAQLVDRLVRLCLEREGPTDADEQLPDDSEHGR